MKTSSRRTSQCPRPPISIGLFQTRWFPSRPDVAYSTISERDPLFFQWLWTDCKVFDPHRPVVGAKRNRVAHALTNQNAGWDNRWSEMYVFSHRLIDGEASDWFKSGASKPLWLVHAVRRSLQYFNFTAYCWISRGEKIGKHVPKYLRIFKTTFSSNYTSFYVRMSD